MLAIDNNNNDGADATINVSCVCVFVCEFGSMTSVLLPRR